MKSVILQEEVKQAVVDSARGICGCVRIGKKNPKSEWWNDQVKPTIERKEVAQKSLLKTGDDIVNKRFIEIYKAIITRVRSQIKVKKEANVQLEGREIRQ